GQLEAEEYTTKTRGDRYQPGARAIAEGCYAFVRHDDHVHLVYRVDRPEPDVPDGVRVPEAASHIVLFERSPTRGQGAVWTVGGDPSLLDEEGAELVLVGVDRSASSALMCCRRLQDHRIATDRRQTPLDVLEQHERAGLKPNAVVPLHAGI